MVLPRSSHSLFSRRMSETNASGTGPPNTPECSGWSMVRTSTVHWQWPRSIVVRTGRPHSMLPMSAMIMTVGLEALGVLLDVGLELRERLFLALDDDLDAHGRLAAEDAQGAGVDRGTALVVGGTAPVHAAVVLHRGRPGIGRPALLHRRGLHVVVPVEQHRRRALRRGNLAPDRRVAAALEIQFLDLEAGVLEHLDDLRASGMHGLGREARERARRVRDERAELVHDLGHHRPRGCFDL